MSQYMSFAIAAVFLILSLFVVFFFFKFITEGRLRRAENTTSSAYIQKLEFRLKHIDVLEEYIKRLFSHTQQLELRLKPIVNLEEEIQRLNGIIHQRTSEIEALRASYDEKKSVYDLLIRQVAIFDEKLSFAEMGVYEPHFDFTDSEEYKKLATEIRSRQKSMISQNTAVICTKKWTLDGSLAKGQTMINRNIRLTLRAFNNECDYVIANARWNNVNSMEKRIINAKVQINKMNDSHSICVIDEYLNLKIKELYLTHEYREKIKFEQDERAQMARLAREEQKFVRDMERAEEDEARYERLLSKAKAEANIIAGPQLEAFNDQIRMLEEDLAKAQAKVIRAQAMAERTRSGFVYIISNIGSFGDDVVKIGLTRRLDPTDRVRELGDASVPFIFDTHAIIYSDDAPTLERALHAEFESVRVNARNYRKEFFKTKIDNVEAAVKRLAPDAPFFKDIEAQDYRETLAKRNAVLLKVDPESPVVFPDSI